MLNVNLSVGITAVANQQVLYPAEYEVECNKLERSRLKIKVGSGYSMKSNVLVHPHWCELLSGSKKEITVSTSSDRKIISSLKYGENIIFEEEQTNAAVKAGWLAITLLIVLPLSFHFRKVRAKSG